MTEEEKIEKIKEIYQEFLDKVSAIEKERDEKLAKIVDGIDKRKIDELMHKIKNT
jgi:hypothetical protein